MLRISTVASAAAALFLLATALAAPAGALDISTLGTSMTASYRWQPVVQKALERCGLGPVHIGNFGKAGETVAWGINHVGQAVESKPDILIIEFAVNDALADRRLSVTEAERLTRLLIQRARQESPNTKIYLLITSVPQGKQLAKRPEMQAHYGLYRKISAEERVGLIDTQPLLGPPGQRPLRDDLHPTNQGYETIMAPAVVAALRPECR
jgi:lysophospholipase L1-like esterase